MIQVGTSVPWVCVKQELSSNSGNFDIFLHRDYLLCIKTG